MKSKQIYFFAEAIDLVPIFQKIESTVQVHYYQIGMLDNKNFREFISILDYPEFGHTSHGDWNHIDRFLLLPLKLPIVVEETQQKKGGVKYSIDQSKNLKSAVIKIGGIFSEGVLVAGSIGTISIDDFSLNIFKLFSSAIKKEFQKIGGFYVGKNALEKLKMGWRLVTIDKSPREYDLKLN